MIRIVAEHGSVSVPMLADMFGISPDTVRRDLDRLAEAGALTRTHGGAVRTREPSVASVADRVATQVDAKRRIAVTAARLITPGETILVNGGSTTLALAMALPAHRSIALITNSIPILDQVDRAAFSHVYGIGGEFLDVSKVLVGPVTFPHADRIEVDTAVLGVRALSATRGISTATVAEAAMISDMIRLARRTIVLADATKFTRSAFAAIAPLDQIDMLVTDAEPPEELRAVLAAAGVETIIATA
ncbi:MAG: DeoR/GlpR family DNA-binding transcription regulator [Amaricoccus sp.]|uniref:DeoR/GlpR family DNA-binding transcription regulator n=1 Tax=Amaricoccus sp. TaxID=1872485 RepID=UPI0039E366BD